MSVQCWELVDSMSGSVTNELEQGETREVNRRYLIGQTNGFNDTVFEIDRYAPAYVNGDGAGIYWVRKRLNITGVGNRYFDCTATYQTLVPKGGGNQEEGGGEFVPGALAWDTTGHKEHITQALDETVYAAGGEPAASFNEAINVSGTSVNGIDVVRPGMRYSETWIMPIEVALSAEYVSAVYSLTGTVNDDTFRAFEAGEALFMGARAQWQTDQPYIPVTFDFEARPNGQFYIKGFAQFEKEGWEYVWIRYQDEASSGTLVKRPVNAYKNRIYKKEDWAGLQIGGSTIGAPTTVAAGSLPETGNPANT